jgi:hypothetical protein
MATHRRCHSHYTSLMPLLHIGIQLNQRADGTVDVPEALKPYLNAELIGKDGLL